MNIQISSQELNHESWGQTRLIFVLIGSIQKDADPNAARRPVFVAYFSACVAQGLPAHP